MVKQGKISKEVHMMVTPRVVEEVRRHFNCSTLEGAELEDQGGEGIFILIHPFLFILYFKIIYHMLLLFVNYL